MEVRKLPYKMNLVRGPYDSSFYWKKEGTYNSEYVVDEELSGATYEVNGGSAYYKTLVEVKVHARLLRQTINFVLF